jgi:signal transduction histidine kinase
MALRKHLKQGPRASMLPARRLGHQAVALGLETLDLARIHEAACASQRISHRRHGIIKWAKMFFSEAITPIEKTHRTALQANARLSQLNKTLGRRTVDLAASSRFLKQGIVQRKAGERALKKSAEHYRRLLKESRRLQNRLRHLTHRILSAQEAERTKVSRELRDQVAQTLLGINVRLLSLKQEATSNTAGLKKEIVSTQRLVGKSVKTLSQFARESGKQHDT